MSEPTVDTTLEDLHVVAELLLAGPQHRASRTIRLQSLPGGFGTVKAPDLRVLDGDLVVAAGTADEQRFALDGALVGELAERSGIDAGAPVDVYTDLTAGDPGRPLRIDAERFRVLAGWYATGDRALRRLAPEPAPQDWPTPVLWPEHFDLAITVDEVNFGVSPGDGFSAVPYAYVGPWTARTGEFWNAPFGAVRTIDQLADEDALLAFFAHGRDLARSGG